MSYENMDREQLIAELERQSNGFSTRQLQMLEKFAENILRTIYNCVDGRISIAMLGLGRKDLAEVFKEQSKKNQL